MIKINFANTKNLLWISSLWLGFLYGASMVFFLQEWDIELLRLPIAISLILLYTFFSFALILSIEKKMSVIQILNVNSTMPSTFDPISLCILLLKINIIIVPLAVLQFIYKFDVFQGGIQQFAYALFFIELLLTFLLYLWTRIELAKNIESILSENEVLKSK